MLDSPPPILQHVERCGSAAYIIDDIIPADYGATTAIINRIDVMKDRQGIEIAWVFTAKTDKGEVVHVIEAAPTLSASDAELLNIERNAGISLTPYNGVIPADTTFTLCKKRQ